MDTEVLHLKEKIANQAERIRYLEGATNHATGTPLSHAKAKVTELEREVARLRDILINPAALRLHVERQFPEYAWEHKDFVARLRAAAEELERRLTIERIRHAPSHHLDLRPAPRRISLGLRFLMSHLPIPDLTPLFKMLGWALVVSVPLALWKLVDIAIWLCRHVDFNWVS